jgi:hypothetical protein
MAALLSGTVIRQGLLWPPTCPVVLHRTVSEVGPHAVETTQCRVVVDYTLHIAHCTLHTTSDRKKHKEGEKITKTLFSDMLLFKKTLTFGSVLWVVFRHVLS